MWGLRPAVFEMKVEACLPEDSDKECYLETICSNWKLPCGREMWLTRNYLPEECRLP